jgi:hypothetical protein
MKKTICIAVACSLVSSCIPGWDTGCLMIFHNCTNDTLFVSASHYDDIDSIDKELTGFFEPDDTVYYSTMSSLCKDSFFRKKWYTLPDSNCVVECNYVTDFGNRDTCYFFLVKYSDAKRYTWDEMRAKKLYGKFVVTKNVNGDFDRNIRYMNP